jgi:hypothetical protein
LRAAPSASGAGIKILPGSFEKGSTPMLLNGSLQLLTQSFPKKSTTINNQVQKLKLVSRSLHGLMNLHLHVSISHFAGGIQHIQSNAVAMNKVTSSCTCVYAEKSCSTENPIPGITRVQAQMRLPNVCNS